MKVTKINYNKNGTITLNLSLEKYKELLKGYNDLRSITQTINECHDLFMSDVRKLESIEWDLYENLGFNRPKDEKGKRDYYANAVLSNATNAWKED
jgi:hypothetical protein